MGALAQVPTAAAKKPASIWDKENRQRTFLALAQAFGAGPNFSDGLSAAAGALGGRMDDLKNGKKQEVPDLVGPNSSFERRIDKDTGAITYVPVVAMQDYLRDSKEKPKDVADMTGRAMYNLQQLPEAQRPAAYADMVANPQDYGLDSDWLRRSTYDPNYVAMRAGMGSNVSQSRTRDTADTTAATRAAQADRGLDIREGRANNLNEATNVRVGLAVSKANKAPSAPPSARKGSGKAAGGMGGRKLGGPTGVMVRVRKKR